MSNFESVNDILRCNGLNERLSAGLLFYCTFIDPLFGCSQQERDKEALIIKYI